MRRDEWAVVVVNGNLYRSASGDAMKCGRCIVHPDLNLMCEDFPRYCGDSSIWIKFLPITERIRHPKF